MGGMRHSFKSVGLTQALGIVTSFVICAQAQDSAECVPAPISLPIVNVSLPSGNVRRGVSMRVGQPPREFSFLPSWDNNNTFLYGPECDLDDFSEEACQTFRGGVYDPDESDSDGTIDSDFSGESEPFPSDTYEFFTDNVTIGDGVFIEDFPLIRPLDVSEWDLQGYRPQHLLGMQAGSTIMNSLIEAGTIASKSWGFFWGLDGRRDQSAGSFVLGGYDRAKTYGDGYTRRMEKTDGCSTNMLVVLEDLVLNLSNGTDVSIFPNTNGGQAHRFCISPTLPGFMDLPLEPFFWNWQVAIQHNLEAGRSGGIDFWNILLSTDDDLGYDGALTLDFGSGFKITMPNDHLVVPERKINGDGEIVANRTQPLLRINSLQDTTEDAFPRLGQYFLSQAYLFCNEDLQEFTLWKANPTSDEDLVAVNADNEIVRGDNICSDRSSPSPPPPPEESEDEHRETPLSTPDSDDEEEDSGSAGVGTGTIIGVAVGGGVAAAMIIGGLFFWWRRHRREKAAKMEIAAIIEQHRPAEKDHKEEPRSPTPQGYPHFIPQELSGQTRRIQEGPFEMF